jgi:elongation factor G
MQPIRNIAVLAHVDAGKTTLSERILFTAGEVRYPGNVEDGLATLDYLPEEKKRGITIESGVAHFEWRGTWFNLIDTPGHVDFGAEVDMALSAVNGAVLVVSAASGVETQTLAAWKKLRSQGIQTVLFINKLDNADYSLDDTLIHIEEELGVRPVLLSFPEYESGRVTGVLDVISGKRLVHGKDGREEAIPAKTAHEALRKYYREAVEFASYADDEVLEAALAEREVSPELLIRGLAKLSGMDDYVLCYAGSALENWSVRSLMTGLSFFLSAPKPFPENVLGQVIRIRHFKETGEFSLFLSMANLSKKELPPHFVFFRMMANQMLPVEEIRAGDIYAMKSETKMELGNRIGKDGTILETKDDPEKPAYRPLLQTQIECLRIEDYDRIEESFSILSRMDPSFQVVHHPEGGFWMLYTVGEVQLEVILSRLAREFDCEVRAGRPEVQWQERLLTPLPPVHNRFQAGPFSVSITLSVSPLPVEEHDIRLKADFLESAPKEILAGVRSALLETAAMGFLGKGALVGVEFQVHEFEASEAAPVPMIKKACADAVILLIKPQNLALFEPYMELSVECPALYAGAITGDIQAREGKVKEIGGDGVMHFIKAEVPLRCFFGYSTEVRSLSRGTAQYSLRFLDYRLHKNMG